MTVELCAQKTNLECLWSPREYKMEYICEVESRELSIFVLEGIINGYE